MKFILLTLAILLIPSQSFACAIYPKEKYADPLDLIKRTENIVLAKAIRAEVKSHPDYSGLSEDEKLMAIVDEEYFFPVKYEFEVIEVLKGSPEKSFTLDGHVLGNNSHYNNHEDKGFWENDEGRTIFAAGDCKRRDGFAVGSVYLMFLNEPYHRKSFERIVSFQNPENEDRWLSYVKNRTVHIKVINE
ncbi:MAG: hypothetical protein R3E13_01680 [Alphaproteobacteria bacterium]